MPSQKRGGAKDQNHRNEGAGDMGRSRTGSEQGGFREGAERATERVQEGYEAAREMVGQGYQRAERAISSNPGPSLLVGFGVGFGLGLVLCALIPKTEESWAERHLPDSLRNAPDSLRHFADNVRHLPEALAHRLPNSIGKHFG